MKQFIDHLEQNPDYQRPKETCLHMCYHDEEKRDCLLIFPGGGYQHLSIKKEGTRISDWGQHLGLHTALLTYQLDPFSPSVLLGELRSIMERLKNDPKIAKIFVIGFSAGGHLAGLLGTLGPNKPDGLLLSYPVTWITGEFAHQGSSDTFYSDPEIDLQKDYSIPRLVTDDTPPCFVWHTVTDQAVPVENSLDLARALSQHKIPYELHLFAEGAHGLGMEDPHHPSYQWVHLAENWLKRF